MENLKGYITIPTYVTLEHDWHDRILQCAHDLQLSEDEVIRAVVNTSVRRHFESGIVPTEEVSVNG